MGRHFICSPAIQKADAFHFIQDLIHSINFHFVAISKSQKLDLILQNAPGFTNKSNTSVVEGLQGALCF